MFTKNYEELKFRVEKHVEEDRVTQGTYWDGHRGCFIGCLNHSEFGNPRFAEEQYGLHKGLQSIAEIIFEGLPVDEATDFFAALPAAVGCNGKDLREVNSEAMANLGWTPIVWGIPNESRAEYYRLGRDLLLELITKAPVNPYFQD